MSLLRKSSSYSGESRRGPARAVFTGSNTVCRSPVYLGILSATRARLVCPKLEGLGKITRTLVRGKRSPADAHVHGLIHFSRCFGSGSQYRWLGLEWAITKSMVSARNPRIRFRCCFESQLIELGDPEPKHAKQKWDQFRARVRICRRSLASTQVCCGLIFPKPHPVLT